MRILLLFPVLLLFVMSCGYYFEVSLSREVAHICPKYSPIIGLERYYYWPQSVVFRFYCEEEEEDGVVYESGEWLPGESVATHYVPAVTHDCKGPDRVISGVHVLTSPYIRYWSFYCSRVGRNWTVSTNDCTNTTFAAGSGVNISLGLAFVSLVDVYTRSTYGLNFKNMWILKTCEIGAAAAMTCNATDPDCSNECCKDIRIYNSQNLICNGSSGLIVQCSDDFYWTGGKSSLCSTDINPTYHYCRLCTGKSFIQHCTEVICSTLGYYKCLTCLEHHPKNGLPLVPNRKGLKCRSPGRVSKFEVLVLRGFINFCFGYNLLCEGTGQKPLTIAIYDANNTKDGLEVEDSSLFLPTCLLNHTFACKVSNRHGSDIKFVSISVSIVPITLDPRTQFIACLGHNVSLPCIEKGRVFIIDWYFRGSLLVDRNSIHYKLLDDRGILLLLSVGKKDAGDYECRIKNGLGQYEKRIWLIVGDYESCG